MPRLFSAIELPDDVRGELRQLHLPMPNARWLSPQDYHLTLRFAGDIDTSLAREFAANLAGIDFDAFFIRLSGLGAFGGNEPHNVWVGVEPSHELEVTRPRARKGRTKCWPSARQAHVQAACHARSFEVFERRSGRAFFHAFWRLSIRTNLHF